MVLIEDMNIPDACKDCYCGAGYGCEIRGQIMTYKEMQTRPDWCPLIDADTLIEDIKKDILTCWYIDKVDKEYALAIIDKHLGRTE